MMSRRLWVYVAVLFMSAVALGLLILPHQDIVEPLPLVALVLLTVALGNMAIELPFAVSMSLAFASVFAGILYAGPLGGAVLGLASSVSLQEIRERKPLVRILFNMAQLFLAGLLAGWVLILAGGRLLSSADYSSQGPVATLLAPTLAVLVFFVLNLAFVGVSLILRTRLTVRQTLDAMNPGSYWVSLLVLALLGYAMAHLISISSWFGLLLLVLPFTMARQTFRVYVELTEAYTETVRSLVAAIEAKDRYTRGHSERVAIHARQLAASLGFSSAEVGLAERAALLHDVGKIGISQTTLTSPVQLTPAEVRQIRRHPVIGADLTQDVAFLSDVVPIVRHHHERVDGAGYPDGLVGSEIPLLARVLAVVDAYDAMTSDRAYRPGMSDDDARVELKRVAGSQLDTRVVTAFTALLDEPSAEVDDQ